MSKGIRKSYETGTKDVLKGSQHSHYMSRIRRRDTKPELMLLKDVKEALKTTADRLIASIRSDPRGKAFVRALRMFSSFAV